MENNEQGENAKMEDDSVDPMTLYEGGRNSKGGCDGERRVLLPNGDTYVGGCHEGLRHGRGVYVFKNGARYDGSWRKGTKHGKGTFLYPDGSRYEGEWKNNMRHGFGSYYYKNNDMYEGTWKEHFRHGLGTYVYNKCGSRLMGTWFRDRLHGPGQLVYPFHRYYGYWENNLPINRGCYVFKNSCMLHGHYVDNSEMIDNDETQETDEFAIRKCDKSIWRSRGITNYDPTLLPAKPTAVVEEGCESPATEKCEDDWFEVADIYLKSRENDYREEQDVEGE